MKQVKIADITVKYSGKGYSLSFREKIEVAKLLEQLNVDVIELGAVENPMADTLLIKSVCSSVKSCVISVPAGLDTHSIDTVWSALSGAVSPRIRIALPVSDAQMEYVAKKKPDTLLSLAGELTEYAKKLCGDVEFVAVDATRSNFDFLSRVIGRAISCGATTVTVCDTAGVMLDSEFGEFVRELYASIPELSGVCLGVECSNELSLADASSIAAISAGACEIKAGVYGQSASSLRNTVGILCAKSEKLGANSRVRTTQLKRITDRISWMCETGRSTHSPFDNGVQEEDGAFLDSNDNAEAVERAVKSLGYELSPEDGVKVFEEFSKIASKKEKVSTKELDAIVASVALQVPPTYRLDSYVINTGNKISATAHMKLKKNNDMLEGISLGDGPIDAAFLAIEQIAGRHFELDDFQIKAVTEGREATGESVVKLRSDGRLYSGRGISTDIVGASINAYINALNKIVYEEG